MEPTKGKAMKIIAFNAADHDGHDVWGSEQFKYAGPLFIHDGGPFWSLGQNRSDDEAIEWVVEGCTTCQVEFMTDDDIRELTW